MLEPSGGVPLPNSMHCPTAMPCPADGPGAVPKEQMAGAGNLLSQTLFKLTQCHMAPSKVFSCANGA